MNNNYYTIEPTQEIQGNTYSLWQPDASTNNKIQIDTGITSNWKYRQYIQKNANDIMKYNTMQSINNSGNNPYTLLNTKPTENTPYLYNSIHETSIHFRNSDLKQEYITKQQIKARLISPSISTNF